MKVATGSTGTQAARRHGLAGLAILSLTFLAALLAATGLNAAPAPGAVERAAREALADRAIQRELPGRARPGPPPDLKKLPGKGPQGGGGGGARVLPEPTTPSRLDLGPIGRLILWVTALIAGAVLLFFIVRELTAFRFGRGRTRHKAGAATRVEAERPEPELPRDELLGEADRLAAAGAFAEAIHLLLLHCLRRLEGSGARAIGRSLTAREILRRTAIPERARKLLSAMVGASEITHFGGRPADEAAYRTCREAYQGLAAETGAIT